MIELDSNLLYSKLASERFCLLILTIVKRSVSVICKYLKVTALFVQNVSIGFQEVYGCARKPSNYLTKTNVYSLNVI